jgi:hypothetical protein
MKVSHLSELHTLHFHTFYGIWARLPSHAKPMRADSADS